MVDPLMNRQRDIILTNSKGKKTGKSEFKQLLPEILLYILGAFKNIMLFLLHGRLIQ